VNGNIQFRRFRISDAIAGMELMHKEYGWTIPDIQKLSIPQFVAVLKYMNRRMKKEMKAMKKKGKR